MNFFISFTVIWFILLQVRNKGQTSSKIISTLNGTRYSIGLYRWLYYCHNPDITSYLSLPQNLNFWFLTLFSENQLRKSQTSRLIYSWKCIDIVRRNSILVTPRSGYDHTTRTKSFSFFAYVLMYLVCLGVRIWSQWKGVVSSRDASFQG